MPTLIKLRHHPFFIKLFNWEYWPFDILYAPLYLYWVVILSVRARGFFFFNATNPSIRNGGFVLESKKEIYDLIPQEYYPVTLFFPTNAEPDQVVSDTIKAGITFPLIAKPDIGMRGMAVEKLLNADQLIVYAQNSKVDFLVQAWVPYKQEAGIFYYRMPDQQKGHITGIVGKEFVTITGDGKSTIEQLLMLDPRYILQIPFLKKSLAEELTIVLPAGEKHLLIPFGNHSRGAKFLDISYLIDQTLIDTMDRICRQVDGFYFGRIDIRYENWEALRKGEQFSIIELNGAGSEPTHMYDPRHSVFFAWWEIIRHWNIMARIALINHRTKKIPYMTIRNGMKIIWENKEYIKKIAPQK